MLSTDGESCTVPHSLQINYIVIVFDCLLFIRKITTESVVASKCNSTHATSTEYLLMYDEYEFIRLHTFDVAGQFH